jgi:hypothetical protein
VSETPDNAPLGNIIAIGVLLILVGLGLSVWAIVFDVSAPVAYADPNALFPDRVVNADRMAQRGLVALAAAANYVSGWIMIVGGLLLRRLNAAR